MKIKAVLIALSHFGTCSIPYHILILVPGVPISYLLIVFFFNGLTSEPHCQRAVYQRGLSEAHTVRLYKSFAF